MFKATALMALLLGIGCVPEHKLTYIDAWVDVGVVDKSLDALVADSPADAFTDTLRDANRHIGDQLVADAGPCGPLLCTELVISNQPDVQKDPAVI